MAKLQHKHYALVLLTVVGVFNYLDRGVMALAMEPIKAEFQLSDSQLGLLTGLAFAFFYAIAGIPIARWADRGNRNHVITLSAGLCSAMLMVCSVAGNFSQFLLARVGVGVGEAGCVPPAQSLLADYFDRAERPRAMAVYWLCAPMAMIFSYIAGGWLIEQLGWRVTFMVIGLPGLALAIIVKFTLREPRSEQQHSAAPIAEARPSMKRVLVVLWQRRAFRHILMTLCLSTFLGNGIFTWMPTFLMRSHGMGTAELGLWIGLGVGVGGLFFTYLGGYLATRYAPRKEALQLKGIAVLIFLSAVCHIVCCLSEHKVMALVFLSIGLGGLLAMTVAPLFAIIQSLVEERMRAVAMAFVLMSTHLIGLGLGPLVIGLISDRLAPGFGQESLRYALLMFSPGFLWYIFHVLKAASTIEDDIRSVEERICATKAEQLATKSNTTSHLSTVSTSA